MHQQTKVLTLYQTGAEKFHTSGDAVQKIATTITTAITTVDSTNQITVGSASDIEVGDEIVLDVNNDSDFGWDYDSKYTVTAKSGTTLTLDDQVRHKHKVGSLVQILTRHFTLKGVDTNTATRPFLYVEYWTDYNNAHTRHIGLKNLRFTQWGNNTRSTYYRGVMIAGYNSEYRDNDNTNGRYQYQSHLQGCVIDSCNTANQSYTGFTTRHPHGFVTRNNVAYHVGSHSFWQWSSQMNLKTYNNYATRSSYATFSNDGNYDQYGETSYNYFTRSDDYGMVFHHFREERPIRHNIVLNHEQRPLYIFYGTGDKVFERFHMDGFRSIPYIGEANGTVNFLDSYMDNRWYKSIDTNKNGLFDSNRYLGNGSPNDRTRYYRTTGKVHHAVYYEHNHQYDAVLESHQGAATYRHSGTGKEREVFTFQGNDYHAYIQSVYVPAGATVRISCKIIYQPLDHTHVQHFLLRNKTDTSIPWGVTEQTTQTKQVCKTALQVTLLNFMGFTSPYNFLQQQLVPGKKSSLLCSRKTKGIFFWWVSKQTMTTDKRSIYFSFPIYL